jgi:predicted alpha/beta-fold hydrolase
MTPRNTLHHRWLLRRWRQEVLTSDRLSTVKRPRAETARSVFQFDDRFIAPRNGFRDAGDYDERTVGPRLLARISVSTLMLHTRNGSLTPDEPVS